MSRELKNEVLEQFLKHINEGLEENGYYVEKMGGNLTAWRRDFSNMSFVIITDGDGNTHKISDYAIISLHRNEDDVDPLCWEVQLESDGKVRWIW